MVAIWEEEWWINGTECSKIHVNTSKKHKFVGNSLYVWRTLRMLRTRVQIQATTCLFFCLTSYLSCKVAKNTRLKVFFLSMKQKFEVIYKYYLTTPHSGRKIKSNQYLPLLTKLTCMGSNIASQSKGLLSFLQVNNLEIIYHNRLYPIWLCVWCF